jgi:glycosyltransferase involved in cell wall biosynthesis
VASDFNLIKSYPGKMLKWGYFPDASKIPYAEGEKSQGDAKEDILRLCWAGRLIELKHPEFAVKVASHLKKSGRKFYLDIAGDGPMRSVLEDMAKRENLLDCVNFLGALPPPEVLAVMDRADIFLFTSNYLEGWGAVVNEAMERGCAVVASNEAGAVPFLIEDKVNGLVYRDGRYDEFEKKVDYLFDNREDIGAFADAASTTIKRLWNAENAARELVRFSSQALLGKDPEPSKEGPLSRAEIIKAPGFMRTLQERNRLE